MSPVTETFLIISVVCLTFVVVGIAWVTQLARGGKPFNINFKGLGVSVSLSKGQPADSRNNTIQRSNYERMD